MKYLSVFGFAAFLAAALTAPAGAQEVLGDTNAAVTGAGSTFAYPILSAWAAGYQRWVAGGGDFPVANAGLDDPPTRPALSYEPIGSLAGTMRVKDGAVDFGASDMPMQSEALATLKLAQFPIVIGGVVAVVNVDGVGPGAIRFNGPLLADIFLGKVRNWSDPAIAALNPGLKLPDAGIVVVRRSDGSGTTFNFTDYLSKVSPEWREKIGSDFIVSWPTGLSAKGNDGVSRAVSQTKNAIGYVEYAHAVKMKLAYAQIENRAGKFIVPSTNAFQSAAAGADWRGTKDFQLMLTNTPGEDAYPIVATVFALMPKGSSRRTQSALQFFQWSLEKGSGDAAALGYVPLPEPLVRLVKAYWLDMLKTGT